MSVRRDRKFYTSLALHEAVAEHLAETPVYVTISGLHGASKVRQHAHGGAVELIDEWVAALERSDTRHLRELLIGEDEHSMDMRNTTVFLSVLGQDERRMILDRVYSNAAE
ncbi:MAG: hypothetical protein JF592_18155 [Microbacterium sp.]|uniref:hypothetical protein n=1 Tax=unclassified Microbacterium TaxID=2609290 RepID=UPI001D95D046|nr:hypothetical protein [Microbacterium sp.]MBW8764472.1 hypothetical protein [Microbacterium sp.]